MKNNKLTLKALKQELENLKKSNTVSPAETHKSSVAHDIKNSYIQNLHMKSSMFYWWLISWGIFFIRKFPFLSKVVGALSLIYGKTTWWQLLVKIRKLFIIFNAAIGMYMVYKTTGFGVDTFWANFAAIGNNYFEIFINFNKRVFNWLVELFDYKLVPGNNTPKPKFNGGGTSWNVLEAINRNSSNLNPYKIIGSDKEEFFSLRDLYKNAKIEPKSWYQDHSWFYYLLGTALVLGGLYAGYKFLIDPLFVESLPSSNPGNNPGNIPRTVVTGSSPEGSITPTYSEVVSSGTKSIVMFMSNQVRKLNPTYWFWSAEDLSNQRNVFLSNQGTENFNNRLYPFTSNNPYDSWFKKLRIHYLGETISELEQRDLDLTRARLSFHPLHLRVQNPSPSFLSPIIPTLSGIGIGIDGPSGSVWSGENYENLVASKLNSLPTTPKVLPNLLPDFEGGIGSWKDHNTMSEKPTDARELMNSIKGKAIDKNNRYAILGVE
jgi:hypothetical protein